MNPVMQFFAELMVDRFWFLIPMAAIVVLFVALMRYSNWSIGLGFKADIWPAIKDDANAVSNWHGNRLLALAIVCAGGAIAGAIVAQL